MGLRSAVAVVVLVALHPTVLRRLSWRAVPVAITSAATLAFYVAANKSTTAADAIFLQSTAPLYVLLLSPLLLRERARRGDLAFLCLSGLGLAAVLAGTPETTPTAPDPARGDLFGLASGVCWGLTILGLRAFGARSSLEALVPMVLGNALAAAACLPLDPHLSGATGVDWAVIAYLGAIQTALAYLLMARGLGGVSAFEASLLLLADPALAPIWALIVHGEAPAALTWAGGALILGSTAWRTLHSRGAVSSP